MSESQKTCHRVPSVLIDADVEADFPWPDQRYWTSLEKRVAQLKSDVGHFNAFCQEHRSWSNVRLRVTEKREDRCSCCERPWEAYEEDGKTFCAYCGAEVVEEPDHD